MKSSLIPIAIAAVFGIATIALLSQRRSGNMAMNAPPIATTDAEQRILTVLDQARAAGRVHLQVNVSGGRMLRLLTEAVAAKGVVEIGTSTGYSGLWICLGLERTGGTLTTFEVDRGRAAMAREHFRQAGVDRRVTVVDGDAHQNIRGLKGPIDIVFLDADKPGYVDYLDQLLPVVRAGGLIIADNFEMAPDYEKAITTAPDLETVFVSGMSITLKKGR